MKVNIWILIGFGWIVGWGFTSLFGNTPVIAIGGISMFFFGMITNGEQRRRSND